MSDGHIFLVGFMGSGKSTVARVVAESLGRACIDLDDVIEREAGKRITQVFATEGEEAFRDLETAALLGIRGRAPSVVACGGGIVLRPANRAALSSMGTVVHLKVTAAEALARIGDLSTRPLLAGPGGTLAATALLQARAQLYGSVSDVEVDTVGRSAEEVAALVLTALGEIQ